MDPLGSEKNETDAKQTPKRAPLCGAKLASANKAMESPGFLPRLTARIMKLARKKGFHSPFKESMDLPGGKSSGDLASDIVEKALDGTFTWDQERIPNFAHFCLSRAESILSNWLERTSHSQTMSPILEDDPESGVLNANPLTTAAAPDDIYTLLRVREGGVMGDRFLEDFALSLPSGSPEQAIVMAVYDDRECGNRAYCREKLNLSEATYDAAIKRLLRRLPVFLQEWRAKNDVNLDEWKEAR